MQVQWWHFHGQQTASICPEASLHATAVCSVIWHVRTIGHYKKQVENLLGKWALCCQRERFRRLWPDDSDRMILYYQFLALKDGMEPGEHKATWLFLKKKVFFSFLSVDNNTALLTLACQMEDFWNISSCIHLVQSPQNCLEDLEDVLTNSLSIIFK